MGSLLKPVCCFSEVLTLWFRGSVTHGLGTSCPLPPCPTCQGGSGLTVCGAGPCGEPGRRRTLCSPQLQAKPTLPGTRGLDKRTRWAGAGAEWAGPGPSGRGRRPGGRGRGRVGGARRSVPWCPVAVGVGQPGQSRGLGRRSTCGRGAVPAVGRPRPCGAFAGSDRHLPGRFFPRYTLAG